MKRVLLVLTLLAVPLGAQEQKVEPQAKPAPPPNIQKVFILKYADPENLRQLLNVFEGRLVPNAEMHALAVTASPSAMEAIEDAIARLDVPSAAPKNFDLAVDLVVGSDAKNPVSASIPKDLDSVIAQLKVAFPFKNYRLLDVLTLRTRAGKQANMNLLGLKGSRLLSFSSADEHCMYICRACGTESSSSLFRSRPSLLLSLLISLRQRRTPSPAYLQPGQCLRLRQVFSRPERTTY